MTDASERFRALREQIDANDRAIVEAVNRRLRLVDELWRLKDAQGAGRLDPERELRLRDELQASNGGPLSADGLDRLVGELLALTKRELGEAR